MNFSTSFCYHSSTGSSGSIESANKLHKASKIGITAAAVSNLALTVLVVVGTLNAPLALGLGLAATALASGLYLYNHKHICATAGIIVNKESLKLPNIRSCVFRTRSLACQNSSETEQWRRRMIESAQHNIIISGNYCGGQAFKELLDSIENRYAEKPDLKVVIISSPKFLTKDIHEKLQRMKTDHPNNFSIVESPDIWHISPGLKKTTNHTKCMVIDYGKYFILGGSGIKDNFVLPGLSSQNKETYLQQTLSPEEFQKTQKLAEPYKKKKPSGAFIDRFMPGCFRDMDFVFNTTSTHKEGQRIFTQSLLLAYRWEQYSKRLKTGIFERLENPIEDITQVGVVSGKQTALKTDDSLTVQLLKTPAPSLSEVTTEVAEFEKKVKKKQGHTTKILTSGPEQASSEYNSQVLDSIKNAKRRLVINHMYFHPTDEVLHAIADAAKRGVKVKIVSCGVFKNCPSSHLVFGPRNKYNFVRLMNLLDDEQRKNVEIYTFAQRNISNHKKVIVSDDRVLAGSSNLGYKSLVTSSDHEINFLTISSRLANETLAICEEDIQHSTKFNPHAKLSWSELQKAYLHRMMAPLIG